MILTHWKTLSNSCSCLGFMRTAHKCIQMILPSLTPSRGSGNASRFVKKLRGKNREYAEKYVYIYIYMYLHTYIRHSIGTHVSFIFIGCIYIYIGHRFRAFEKINPWVPKDFDLPNGVSVTSIHQASAPISFEGGGTHIYAIHRYLPKKMGVWIIWIPKKSSKKKLKTTFPNHGKRDVQD